jgi:HK97 family phage major capsid protein
MDFKEFLAAMDAKMEQFKTGVSAEAKKELDLMRDELKAAKEGYDKASQSAEAQKALFEKLEEKFDKLIAKAGRAGSGGAQVKSFGNELGEKLVEAKSKLEAYKTEKKGFSLELEAKAVGDMAAANLTGSYFVQPDYVPGVSALPYESVHVRDLLPKGSTTSNTVRYVRDMGGEGGAGMTAQGAIKSQVDRDLQIFDAPVRKITTYFRLPEEMIEDIDYMQSFLVNIGLEEVMLTEDNQILYGDGTGQNLSGFNTVGTAFAAGTSVIGATANEFDVIGAAKKQLRVAKFGGPLYALISPINYYDMRYKRKDTTNNYIFQAPSLNPMGGALQADGVTILEHTAVTAGDFFVFAPRAAQVVDRKGTSVRFFDQDQDNAVKNLVTVVIEKREALPIYFPGSIIRGTFTSAITDLTS